MLSRKKSPGFFIDDRATRNIKTNRSPKKIKVTVHPSSAHRYAPNGQGRTTT